MQMIIWLLATADICLITALAILAINHRRLRTRTDSWTSNLAVNLGKLQAAVRDLDDEQTRLYDMIQEYAKKPEELKTKIEAIDEAVKSMMQEDEDATGEKVRRKDLLEQLNNEMERQLKMEKSWNDGLANILDYNLNIAAGGNSNE